MAFASAPATLVLNKKFLRLMTNDFTACSQVLLEISIAPYSKSLSIASFCPSAYLIALPNKDLGRAAQADKACQNCSNKGLKNSFFLLILAELFKLAHFFSWWKI